MKNYFKLGVNLDKKVLNEIIEQNNNFSESKIAEVYGSDAKHYELAARPQFRLPDITESELQKYIERCKYNQISFNYTANSIIPYGSKQEFVKHKEDIKLWLNKLISFGVHRITIANPIMLELIRNEMNSNILIECSTIMHIDTITQIKYLYDTYGVDKICCNLNKIRDFNFLKRAAKYCNDNKIILELMVNEFCGVGGEDYATHCVYRDSCYICHSTNKTYEDTLASNNYPMSLCSKSRNISPSNWLRMRFIRPEDIKYYNDIGINHFKITGRTGSSNFIIKVLKAYLNQSYDGNLLELWKPLESINKDNSGEDKFTTYIDNKKLDGFVKHWVNGFVCDNVVCGEDCEYCKKWYERMCK